MPKTYLAIRTGPTARRGPVQAEVADPRGSRPLRHVVHHSPTGFEFGYDGSGPADLALSIMADYFGAEGEYAGGFFDKRRGWSDETGQYEADNPWNWTLATYQAFKRRFVAPVSGPNLHVHEWQIAKFVNEWYEANVAGLGEGWNLTRERLPEIPPEATS